MSKLPTPSNTQRFIVAAVALLAGAYVVMDSGKDFEFIKFEPHSPEEIERRKRENVGLSLKVLETSTLNYTPEAKERLRKLIEEKSKETESNASKN
ncbi:uncharacterized protein RJT21DRAFT_117981 [Scheffersomyces amazonensis]|uniref:uncharacterized protein n=1 Tax=Scheffersomyces amazonensis TaxID=1078765 RepID=UPI00315CD559